MPSICIAVASFFLQVFLVSSALATETDAHAADQSLNATYQYLQSTLEKAQQQLLRKAQRSWITFRDSACSFESTLKDTRSSELATQQPARSNHDICIQRLTLERLADLNRYRTFISKTSKPDTIDPLSKQLHGCKLTGLPSSFTIQAVGLYEGGLDTDVQLEQSGHATKAVEVVVNKPRENVILILMAYDPVFWRISKTHETNIIATLVGGNHAQAVTGITQSTPLLISTYNARKDCEQYFYAYEAGERLLKVNAMIKELTGRDIDHISTNYRSERLYIGHPLPSDATLESSDDYKAEHYTQLPRIASGKRGLEQLMQQGLLRQATSNDIESWVNKASAKFKKFNSDMKVNPRIYPGETYVVHGKMTFPPGLYGGESVVFLIEPGVPLPDGNPGHSKILFLEDGTCYGIRCGSDD